MDGCFHVDLVDQYYPGGVFTEVSYGEIALDILSCFSVKNGQSGEAHTMILSTVYE